MMKKYGLTATVLAGVFLMAFAFQPQEAMSETFTLKYSDPSPPGSARTQSLADWGEWLNKRTNGRIKIQWYWSQSLAKARDNIHAVKGGIADMATNSGLVYQRSLIPIFQFAEMPFIGPADWDSHAKAVMEMTRTVPELKKEIEKTGIKLISANAGHPTHFMSKKPIRKLEDFKGLRIRALGGLADFVKAAGGKAVPLTVYETYEGLQKGTVDASQAYMYYNIPSKFFEVTKYSILPGMQNITTTMWMNMDLYKKFPKDIQKILDDEAAGKYQEFTTRSMDEVWDSSVAALKKAGIEFITIAPEEFARWTELGKKAAHSKWFKKMEKKGVDGEKILQQYAETYKKYERKR